MTIRDLDIIIAKVIAFLVRHKLILENVLTESVIKSLEFFSVMVEKNVSETAHDGYVRLSNWLLHNNNLLAPDDIIRRGRNLEFGKLSVYPRLIIDGNTITLLNANDAAEQLQELTGIKHIRIPCCKNSCIAYTGDYIGLNWCPLYSEPRCDKKNNPICTFDLLPIAHCLQLQFANPTRAKALQEYPQSLQDIPWDGVRDYWDGKLHKEHKSKGFFTDPRDIALAFSTDGLQLFKVGNDSVWPLLLINLNLKPNECFKKHNLLLCGIIPGPNNPKDIHSFLRPIVEELKELA